MLSMNDLKLGVVITWEGKPWVVQYAQHVQMGRGSAVVRTKIKNLIDGRMQEQTFKGGDKLEEADLTRVQAQFLYKEEGQLLFMDNASYEQFGLGEEQVGELTKYVKEGQDVEVMHFQGKPVSVFLPKKVELKVIETEPAVRGDTAQGSVSKPATLETGLVLQVPLFVKQDDVIRVNTETGLYVERA